MFNIYEYNNIPFWNEQQILAKKQFVEMIQFELKSYLQEKNSAWIFEQIESPILIPLDLLNPEYNEDDIFIIPEKDQNKKQLALRPETTPATYEWMKKRLIDKNVKPPYCCWQINKSFRREQDQPSKHVRLKEFYQQEFQCAYTEDSFQDWQEALVPFVKNLVRKITNCPTRVVISDRLPKYSVCTIDIEVWNSEKWMEICSISKRNDFPQVYQKKIIVCEIATSPDRQYYCHSQSQQAWNNLNKDEMKDGDWINAMIPNKDVFKITS